MFVHGKWQPIPAVSPTSAFLLKPTDKIRFVPAADWFGSATIPDCAGRRTGTDNRPKSTPPTGAEFSVEEDGTHDRHTGE